jgi:hypothetical protein
LHTGVKTVERPTIPLGRHAQASLSRPLTYMVRSLHGLTDPREAAPFSEVPTEPLG